MHTTSRPYTLTGLPEDELRKIKVYAYTEKKNLFGKWKNPRYRLVKTLTQSTRRAPVLDPTGNIEFAGATSNSATVRVNWSHPHLLERIVVCYAKTWNFFHRLDSGCTSWFLPNPSYGWAPTDGAISFTNDIIVPNLSKCSQYKFAAFGFGSEGGQIGEEIRGGTSGKCWWSLISLFIAADDDLATHYVGDVEAFYGESLADHILRENPHLGREHHSLRVGGEKVYEPLILLEYLTEAHPAVVDAWQEELGLREAGLAVDQFLEVRNPELLRVLQEDLAAEDVLSLNDDRFEVFVTWETPDGDSGPGQPVPLTVDTGYFWFFDQDNVELVVKVLDACVPPFDRFWVFAAGLTDVAVDVTVVDTVTDATFSFQNPQGQAFQPVQATDAFATCP